MQNPKKNMTLTNWNQNDAWTNHKQSNCQYTSQPPPYKELITLLSIAIESSSNLLRKIKTKGFKKSKELI
jgi:hypothetical protein